MARFVYASAEADDETDMLLYEDGARLFATREIRLHRHYGAMILAFEGEDMVGVAALAPFPADDSLEFAIAVHPRHERKGVARKLVAAVLMDASGVLRSWLTAASSASCTAPVSPRGKPRGLMLAEKSRRSPRLTPRVRAR